MPKALAIETSGRTGSVALAESDRILAEETFPHGLQHAAGILVIIDKLCRQANWRPADLDVVYVSAGPGSFTGLRIGITLAKTLALALGVKIVAVPSVCVLAENAPPEARHLIITLDAKRGQVFTARFERTTEGWQEREPAHLDTLTNMLSRAPRPVHLLGEGLPYHQNLIPIDDARIFLCGEESWRARAEVVARLGKEMADRNEFADPYKLTPIYIRPPEAEEKRNAGQAAPKLQ